MLLSLAGLRRTNRIYRTRLSAERTIDAPLFGYLQFLPRQCTEHAEQSTIRTQELAERTTDEDGHHQQHNAKADHADITSQTEDADKGIQATNEKLTARSCIEDSEGQINPRNDGQGGRNGTCQSEMLDVDQLLQSPQRTHTRAEHPTTQQGK